MMLKGVSAESPMLSAWRSGMDVAGAFADQLRSPYSQNPSVHVAIRTNASQLGSLDAQVWPRGADRKRDRPIENHWLPLLLEMPGTGLRGDTLKQAISTYLDTYGECWLWKLAPVRGSPTGSLKPTMLALLHPLSMWPVNASLLACDSEWWDWNGPQGTKRIPREELISFKLFNPYNPVRGLPPTAAAAIEIGADHSIAIWDRSWFQNSAIPPIVFTVDGKDSDWPVEERKAFLAGWNIEQAGASKAGFAAALPPGVKPYDFQINSQAMQVLESRRFKREQILAVYGVLPAVAGAFDPGNFANRREQLKIYWQVTMGPRCRYVASVLTEDLLAASEPANMVDFDLERVNADLMSADLQQKVAAGYQLFQMGFRPTDINETLGLGLRTDNAPWLEEGWMPWNLTLARTLLEPPDPEAAPKPGAPSTPPTDAEDDTDPEDDPDAEDAADEQAEKGVLSAALDATARLLSILKQSPRDQRWKGITARYADIARTYQRALRSWMWGLRREVLSNLERKKAHRGVNLQLLGKSALVKGLADEVLWSDNESLVTLRSVSKGPWSRALERGAAAVRDEAALSVSFDHLSPEVLAFLREKAVKIAGVNNTVKEHVRDAIREGIEKGETIDQIAARVRDQFDVERDRATMIARTETAQAFNGGRFEQMRQAGVTSKEWLSSRDDRVRDTHAVMDQQVRKLEDPFTTPDGIELDYPGDVAGPAEEVINCRCVSVVAEGPASED